MRFARIAHEGAPRVVVVEQEAWALLPGEIDDLHTLIEGAADAMAYVRRALRTAPRVAPDEDHLLAPLGRFCRDVLCTGWNYLDHFHEGAGRREGQDVDLPQHPTFFGKSPHTVIGPRDPIAFDERVSTQWDYEAELALVIGRRGRSIPVSRAADHVWGYLLANDVSQRDLQRAHGGQWLKGKSVDRTMPIGPWIVTADEIEPADIRLRCVINGELMQDASTGTMAYPIPTLIEQLSFGMTLDVGDLVLTGTPSGVGNARDPRRFLRSGDEVIVSGTGLGELRNVVTPVALHTPG
jgi:2-keto-4-pentenoate hydratase/2-oxohepta-3-ene-1,7-dioic acid hydratase in catechol pathway